MNTDNITITIKPDPNGVDIEKYQDNNNCYIAEALKELGYKEVTVSGFGITEIAGKTYRPIHNFNYEILDDNFSANRETKVVLKPSYSWDRW